MIYRYRLWDNQCSRYMATGYNATSKKELCESYADYKSGDWDDYDDEDDNMFTHWAKMSMKDKMVYIQEDEFTIEKRLLIPYKNYDY